MAAVRETAQPTAAFRPRVPQVPEGEDAPISIYGPSRRATKLHTSIPVPATGTVHLGFDTSYTWISSKLVRYAAAACAVPPPQT